MKEFANQTNREVERENVIARLIANTRRRKRPNSLIEIARDIRWLQNDLGSLKAVSETIGLSMDMLGQFLSVEWLSPTARKLVEQRKIDLVRIVNCMRGFDAEEQEVIAREVIAGRLSGEDIKVLAPLHKSLPHVTIDELISHVQRSRDIRVYVAYFRVPPGFRNAAALEKRFAEIVGQAGIVSLTVKGQIGTIELTRSGRKKLTEAAKECKLPLRKFVDAIVLNLDKSR
jgi:hypothetical protein